MNWQLLLQLIFSLFIVVFIWVLCTAYYVLGLKRGHQEGIITGADYAQKAITEAIKANLVTLDGKPVRIVDEIKKAVQPESSIVYGSEGSGWTAKRLNTMEQSDALVGSGETMEQAKDELIRKERAKG
jgi:hypothetical protein